MKIAPIVFEVSYFVAAGSRMFTVTVPSGLAPFQNTNNTSKLMNIVIPMRPAATIGSRLAKSFTRANKTFT